MEVFVVKREAELLAQCFHILQGIDTRRQDEEDRGPRSAFFVRLGELHLTIFHVFRTHLFFHEAAA